MSEYSEVEILSLPLSEEWGRSFDVTRDGFVYTHKGTGEVTSTHPIISTAL